MPCEGEQSRSLHLLDSGLPSDVLKAGVGYAAGRHLPRREGTIQLHPEPFAKLVVIGQRPPNPLNRGVQFDALLDTIRHEAISCLLIASRDGTEDATKKLLLRALKG